MSLFKQINYFFNIYVLTACFCSASAEPIKVIPPSATKEEVIDLKKTVMALFPRSGGMMPGYHTDIREYELIGLTKSELASFVQHLSHGGDPKSMFGGPPELSSDGTELIIFRDLDHGPEYFRLTYKDDRVDTVQHHVGGFVGDRLPGFSQAFQPQDGPILNNKQSAMEYTLEEKDWQIHSKYYQDSPLAIAHFYCVCGQVHLDRGEWQKAKDDFLSAKAQLLESNNLVKPSPCPANQKLDHPSSPFKIMRID